MKILLVSDNHGDQEILDQLASRYHDQVDLMLHLGDSEAKADNLIWSLMDTVKGNMDFESMPTIRNYQLTEHCQLTITHGHLYNVNRHLDDLLALAKIEGSQIVAYGHTHIMDYQEINGITVVNPGSISRPRGSYPMGSFAILELAGDQVKGVTFYNRDFEVIVEK